LSEQLLPSNTCVLIRGEKNSYSELLKTTGTHHLPIHLVKRKLSSNLLLASTKLTLINPSKLETSRAVLERPEVLPQSDTLSGRRCVFMAPWSCWQLSVWQWKLWVEACLNIEEL